MPRYEVTGTATDVYTCAQVRRALVRSGAKTVRARRAFGWMNQPLVATFYADDASEAQRLCDAARADLGPGNLPALLPTAYGLKKGTA